MKKYGFSDRTQGGQILFLQGASPSWKRAKKESNGQTKILGPASVIWGQILEIWSQKGQPGNPA